MVMFKRMAAAVFGLLGLLLVVMLVSRYWPASVVQKQARAALEGPVAWPGDNGWALLETLSHEDLDMAQRQALVDDRAARFAQWVQATAAQRYGEPEPGPVQHGQLPELALPGQRWPADDLLCRSGSRDCLAQVRRDPQAVVVALQARQGVIERVAALADYGHVRSPYLADVNMPLPGSFPRLFDTLPAHALAHVQGDSTRAMAGLCRDMGTGRMLLGHSDSLIVAMLGQSMLQANTQLLAQVLAELPPSTPLPESCAAVLVPLSVEQMSLCTPMRGEYAIGAATLRQSFEHGMGDRPGASWLFNVDKTLDRNAAYLGQGCLAPLRQRVAQDLPAKPDLAVSSLWRVECPANAIGCILSATAGPAYRNYLLRAQDAGAQQRLLAALVWLRVQPGDESLAQRLQRLPAELVSPQRPIRLSADGRALQMDHYYGDDQSSPYGSLSLPLPQAWWPAPAPVTAADTPAP